MNLSTEKHQRTIVEQFSRQAIPFAQVPGHADAIGILMHLAEVAGADRVLDVACGPGLVACAFAERAGRVTGVDITPAMIAEAQRRQREKGLSNLEWAVGDAAPLPYPDDSFSVVITRYSFHHFLAPEAALKEMIRVCRPGGRVLVADVALPECHSAAYDRLELMRDPSHVHALTLQEFGDLFASSGLIECRQSGYGVDIELETQLRASFPEPGDEATLRAMVTGDIGRNTLGIDARRRDGRVVYTCPITVMVGRKAAAP